MKAGAMNSKHVSVYSHETSSPVESSMRYDTEMTVVELDFDHHFSGQRFDQFGGVPLRSGCRSGPEIVPEFNHKHVRFLDVEVISSEDEPTDDGHAEVSHRMPATPCPSFSSWTLCSLSPSISLRRSPEFGSTLAYQEEANTTSPCVSLSTNCLYDALGTHLQARGSSFDEDQITKCARADSGGALHTLNTLSGPVPMAMHVTPMDTHLPVPINVNLFESLGLHAQQAT